MKEEIKILLVDDRTSDREWFTRNLKSIGYSQIKEAVNGQEAINLAEEYKPHLVLMDTKMPGIEGYEACKKIRQEEYGTNIAIIGMSDGPYKREWLQAGADDFLSKDTICFKKDVLEKRIQEVLDKYQA
jgi:CheY-like chemotaxis protein